eukprot:CAMPEP_0174735182 /NCGR_PEP_ID=MMETSP1094-20130205/64535_1 /TAXON_ID=156173 /ORGANISM="Chrysochromulina brevifilum, Strain UTEX LB 985" /LENGTH=116 /DNA_ID=CAMNT_0015938113 /DNA_START=365 /DNA_END=712 /DNA_ORIENTATION=+
MRDRERMAHIITALVRGGVQAHAAGCMNRAMVTPSLRLMSTFPFGASAVTTASSPTKAKLCEASSATAPLHPSGTVPSLCNASPFASTHMAPMTPSFCNAAAQVDAKEDMRAPCPA